MNRLQALAGHGQSVWLDYVRRDLLIGGGLAQLIAEDGVVGVTSNPSIFEKAIGGSADYDQAIKASVERGLDAARIFESLAIEDIQHAADVLRPVYDRTGGVDGYISLEVSPYLALATEDTVAEGLRLWSAVDRPNLMVKVPGTEAGVPAIRRLIGQGVNVNVTLLFAISAYDAVADAFMAGLEDYAGQGGDVARVASVASFFVSRIDSAVEKAIATRLDAASSDDAAALRALDGKVAIANAKIAYEHYQALIGSDRWKALAARGAMPQRLLWASTGTKNKAFSDVLYVEALIGPDTVDTMPVPTMDAFRDHGEAATTVTAGLDEARHVLAEASRLGLDLDRITSDLVKEGVQLFADAADKLYAAVEGKRQTLLGARFDRADYRVGSYRDAVDAVLEHWRAEGLIRRVWARDPAVWTGGDEGKWLVWLDAVAEQQGRIADYQDFQADIARQDFRDVLLLGMGGSSLGPEVLARTFGPQPGYPVLHVLDSTDPAQVRSFENEIDPARTLFIVSSKSGGTLEPNILKQYFFEVARKAVGELAGGRFVAVTDPGSKMQTVAERDGFRRIFFGDPGIGGRYSVLSPFGVAPGAAMGLDVARFLADAAVMVQACGPMVPPEGNPGVMLGAILGVLGKAGRDKITIIASSGISDLGAWLEQLIAESTGKNGKGLIPIDGEPFGSPAVYGDDRVFAYLRLADGADPAQDAAIDALADSGQPVVRIDIADRRLLGQEFFRWEMAVAVAGAIIGIDPFDQPDVEASKLKTRALTDAYEATGALPAEEPFFAADGIALFADPANVAALKGAVKAETLNGFVAAHLARVGRGDYVALLAYIERNPGHIATLTELRRVIRDHTLAATCVGFGPRFLHSTGQAYKGGPNSGVFLQITCDDANDIAVPGQTYSFGTVKAAQARGDFDVLAERGRRALRLHLTDPETGLAKIAAAIAKALG